MNKILSINELKKKALSVRRETLLLHARAPETRVASSLSAVELFVALHYAEIMAFNPKDPFWSCRDRLIISKGHGSICYYPILADLGYFDKSELEKICTHGSFLGGIPDTIIPGYETINGSLGHGLGVACGIALALKEKSSDSIVFVMVGDGELNEGSVWEAVMFAAQHQLDNIVLIVDNNKTCMLDRSIKVINLEPMEPRFTSFGWQSFRIDGHNMELVCSTLKTCKTTRNGIPKVIIADTVKGKGVSILENDSLSHVKSLNEQEMKIALEELK